MDKKKEYAIFLLTEKARELGRNPKRADFSDRDVCFIKQKLGPWPRALEAAGLKEPPAVSAKEKSRMKREKRKKLKASKKLVKTENVVSENVVQEDI